jgi:hypothetical protein
MRALSPTELLSVWERGMDLPPAHRAMLLLAAAFPGIPPESLAEFSVGWRDGRLLDLRHATFGPRLISVASCPECGERLELNFNVADIQTSSNGEKADPLELKLDGYEARFRLPNGRDLMAMAGGPAHESIATARQFLASRCLIAASHDGQEVDAENLPGDLLGAMAARMAEADPQADVQLKISCVKCRLQWQMTFDIVSYFWSEIHAWAERLLREVHLLARAYGWREADIIAMSPQRRRFYLEMITQ